MLSTPYIIIYRFPKFPEVLPKKNARNQVELPFYGKKRLVVRQVGANELTLSSFSHHLCLHQLRSSPRLLCRAPPSPHYSLLPPTSSSSKPNICETINELAQMGLSESLPNKVEAALYLLSGFFTHSNIIWYVFANRTRWILICNFCTVTCPSREDVEWLVQSGRVGSDDFEGEVP